MVGNGGPHYVILDLKYKHGDFSECDLSNYLVLTRLQIALDQS